MTQDNPDLFDKVPDVLGLVGRKLQVEKVNNVDGKTLSTINAEPTTDLANKNASFVQEGS